jgi:hypothetical protein
MSSAGITDAQLPKAILRYGEAVAVLSWPHRPGLLLGLVSKVVEHYQHVVIYDVMRERGGLENLHTEIIGFSA